ncbi:hypothetical protein CBER1_06348 [Cercospora berteroae]|uniref:Uncharacterized protein n=1 Tax=Cercospora berteroae TaxID=357750 RepID=A0A2S6C2X5_9PEZI|nr:hypothetical protein CBER1_06348 [Cercospora berteroae]
MKDLLLSQRINKQCKEAVDSSTRIRKALFLTPGNAEETNVESTDLPEVRSQINEVPVGKLSAMVADEWNCGQGSAVVVESGIAFNTLLVDRLEFNWSDAGNACVEATISPKLRKLPEYASCHKMLTTQPPIDFPCIKFYGTSREAFGSGDFHMPAFLPESPEGTSLARLNQTFERRAKQLKKCGVILVPSGFVLVSTRD